MKRTGLISGILSLALIVTAAFAPAASAKSPVEADRTVYDFGDILTSQGPVSCSFHLKNTSSKSVTILNVISSCGCTEASWTKEALAPGEVATVSATFKNDSGPYPFDKTLSVYLSGEKQPLVLHLRGTAHDKARPLSELYPVHLAGSLGLKDTLITGGTMSQGQIKSGEVKVANLGKSPIKLSFKDLDSGLSLKVIPDAAPGGSEAIPAGGTATLSFSIKADRSRWGSSIFRARPVVDGRAAGQVIGIKVVIKDDFSALSREQKAQGPNPIFENGTFAFGRVKAGEKIKVTFNGRNAGKQKLVFYKADSDNPAATFAPLPEIEPGKTAVFEATLDTSLLPKGETLVIVSLVTNSPLRPIVNLFISGVIE